MRFALLGMLLSLTSPAFGDVRPSRGWPPPPTPRPRPTQPSRPASDARPASDVPSQPTSSPATAVDPDGDFDPRETVTVLTIAAVAGLGLLARSWTSTSRASSARVTVGSAS